MKCKTGVGVRVGEKFCADVSELLCTLIQQFSVTLRSFEFLASNLKIRGGGDKNLSVMAVYYFWMTNRYLPFN